MESKIRDLRQEIFKFEQLSNFDKNDFFVSECNYFAFNLIKSWPNWEKKILNIYGERKSGKSHLSNIFLENKKGIKFKFKGLNKKIFDHYSLHHFFVKKSHAADHLIHYQI